MKRLTVGQKGKILTIIMCILKIGGSAICKVWCFVIAIILPSLCGASAMKSPEWTGLQLLIRPAFWPIMFVHLITQGLLLLRPTAFRIKKILFLQPLMYVDI